MKNLYSKLFFVSGLALIHMAATAQTPGAALDFDGIDDLVYVNHSNAFNVSTALSLEAWIKTTGTSENYICTKNNDSWYLAINGAGVTAMNGKLSFFLNGVTGGWLNGTTNVSDGNWHHVAAVYNGSQIKLYVDGNQDASINASGSVSTGTSSVYIGFRALSAVSLRYFSGTMDEVRIWNVARSQCEIQSFRSCEISTNETGLLANYHFNQGAAGGTNANVNTLIDASGAHTGTLSSFSLSSANSNWIAPGGVTSGNTNPANSLSVVIAAGNTNLCFGENTVLNASGASTYSWSNGASAQTISVSPGASTSYTVIGSTGSCKGTATLQINVSACTDLASHAGSLMKVFPNPASGYLMIEKANDYANARVEIVNTSGQVLQTFWLRERENRVNISNLEAGIYFVRINGGTTSFSKFIKQ